MRADPHVVSDHAKIIDRARRLRSPCRQSRRSRPRVRADLDIITDDDTADLRHLDPAFRRHCIAETVSTKHDTRMENTALANGSRHQRHVGNEAAIVAE